MLPASVEALERRLADGDLVLDVGGWADPLPRADWVIDLMPYATRGGYSRAPTSVPERFSEDTWVQRDICAREPWPFADGQFDFAVCSHTLEDVRDPVFVCAELTRVARAGYVEVPSRLEEQSYGVQGPWAGWGHHHWLVDVTARGLEFVLKPHVIHGRDTDRFPAGFHETLSAAERVQTLWWDGELAASERIFVGPGELDRYLADFVSANLARFGRPPARPEGWSERLRRRLLPPAGS